MSDKNEIYYILNVLLYFAIMISQNISERVDVYNTINLF